MLTTKVAVKATLNIQTADEDVLLDLLIEQASSAIEAHCRRGFGVADEEQEFDLSAPQVELFLRRTPVDTIHSVAENGVEVGTSGFRLKDKASIVRVGASDGRWPPGMVTVSYRGGYILPGVPGKNLPAAIERACIQLVRQWRAEARVNPLVKSRSTEGVGETSFWIGGPPGGLPSDVKALLAPFNRWIVA